MKLVTDYTEYILSQLQAQYQGRDLKIDPRDIAITLGGLYSEAIRAGYVDNWKKRLSGTIDDSWIVTQEWLTVTDASDYSYVALNINWVSLEDNLGIDQVYFRNNGSTKYYNPVIIRSWKDISSYQNTVGGYLEERISCFIKRATNGSGKIVPLLFFDRGNINATYGQIGIRFVSGSTEIDTTTYLNISADLENRILNQCIEFYRLRLAQPQDLIKDADEVSLRK